MKLVEGHNRKVFKPGYLAQVIFVHLLSAWVLIFHFSLPMALLALLGVAITGYPMGIFHHMQLTHSSFQSKKWVTRLGAFLATLTWRGPFAPPLKYVAAHLIHHRFSDTELDPHTPTVSIYHAIMGWFWAMPFGLDKREQYLNYVPDHLKEDKYLQFFDKHTNFLQLMLAIVIFTTGYLMDPLAQPLLSGAVFVGYFIGLKTVLVLWIVNAVDVVNHMSGYRNFDTNDQSTNSTIMAGFHLGGAISWHNNHHAYPTYFTVKVKWWEFDVHYQFLKLLEKFGLVWNIRAKIFEDGKVPSRTPPEPA